MGINGGMKFDPSKSLVLHAHLHEYLKSGNGNLELKLYSETELESDVKKSYDELVEDAFKKANSKVLLGEFPSNEPSGDFVSFDIEPQIFKTLINNCSSAANHESTQAILDATMNAQFSVVIENSDRIVAKFLLPTIDSNNLYFDSAVEMLKSPSNRSLENITIWSDMMMATAHSSWDCISPEEMYKKTMIESVPLTSDDPKLQKFQVDVELPKMIGVLDFDEDISLLVENCDSDISFIDNDPKSRFLHLVDSSKGSKSDRGIGRKFEWNATYGGNVERSVEMKVSILIKLNYDDRFHTRKIGKTVSIVKMMGGGSKKHFSSLKLRNSVKMGLEDASDTECSISNFLETVFKIAITLSAENELDDVKRSLLEKAADDVAALFYKNVASSGNSEFEKIVTSQIFSSHGREFDDLKDIEEAEIEQLKIAEVLESTFAWLQTYHRESLIGWVDSMLKDEDFHDLVDDEDEDGGNLNDLFQTYRENVRQVLQMEKEDLLLQLKDHPDLMEDFVVAGEMVYDEIKGIKPPDDGENPENTMVAFEQLMNEQSLNEIETMTRAAVQTMDEDMELVGLYQVDPANVSASKLQAYCRKWI
jgi:hypothetical protein